MSLLAANGEPLESISAPRTLITDGYAELNTTLHETSPEYGTSGQMWARYVSKLVETEKYNTILDYGCGKGTLARALPDIKIFEYDPCIAGKEMRPAPAELVICTDVLEHIEPELLDNVLADIRSLTTKKLFFNVATRPAKKILADGRNAHILQQEAPWWFEKLREHFTLTMWEVREGMVYGEGLPGGGLTGMLRGSGYKRRSRKQRRRVEQEMQPLVKLIRDATAKYGDVSSRVHTAAQWEPWDSTRADLLVCGGVLEKLDASKGPMGSELERAMTALCLHAKLCICVIIALDSLRGPDWWRTFLERYLHISDWNIQNGCLYCIGSQMSRVQGIKPVMAVKDEELWVSVEANLVKFPQRVKASPAHGRTAILACYGPSLPDGLFGIAQEYALGNADIISVSGAHDFLLSHAITPNFHVECDPRPHKALNIDKGVPGIRYQIASLVHADVFARLEGCDIELWHVSMQDFMMKLVDVYKENPDCVISGGGSVGLRAIPLYYAQGYRDFSVHAMDCSFTEEGAKQWAGKHAGKTQAVTTCKVGERLFYTSPVLMTYATNFMDQLRKMDDCTFRVWGDGLLAAMVRHYAGLEP